MVFHTMIILQNGVQDGYQYGCRDAYATLFAALFTPDHAQNHDIFSE